MSASKNATKETKSNVQSVENGGNGVRPSFVKYRLSEAEVSQARNACAELADLGGVIEQFIDEGYKFSASKDNYGGGIQAFLTPQKHENPNWGWSLTARAPDVRLAVGMLAFKHWTLFSQNWPKDPAQAKGETWG